MASTTTTAAAGSTNDGAAKQGETTTTTTSARGWVGPDRGVGGRLTAVDEFIHEQVRRVESTGDPHVARSGRRLVVARRDRLMRS